MKLDRVSGNKMHPLTIVKHSFKSKAAERTPHSSVPLYRMLSRADKTAQIISNTDLLLSSEDVESLHRAAKNTNKDRNTHL